MLAGLSIFIGLAAIFVLLWWPQWEDDRRKQRLRAHEREMQRLDLLINHGIDIEDVEHEHLEEVVYWMLHGRGKPYR